MNAPEYNLIGDVAGNFKTLMALLYQMPSATPYSLGDMCDRGPASNLVLNFFRYQGNALQGNHEHMLLDANTSGNYYEDGVWSANGGDATIQSFGVPSAKALPVEIATWIAGLPLYDAYDDLFLSHAPKNPNYTLAQVMDLGAGFATDRWGSKNYHRMSETLIWNRGTPRRMPDRFQVFGHNSKRQVEYYADAKGQFAACIDTCRGGILTGMHWPSKQIYQQPIID